MESDNFCGNCGARFPTSGKESLIMDYFRKGFKYTEIVDLLFVKRGIKLSLRTLKSNLKLYGLKRKNLNFDVERVVKKLQEEVTGSSSNFGYRTMWQHLRQNHCMYVPRDTIMELIRHVDPDGVSARKSRKLKRRKYHSLGPNHCWKVDGYDKLKPYGFPIHACIDGFSRKIIGLNWLNQTITLQLLHPYF